MSNEGSKAIRSPSYPNMSLRDAVAAVGKIEAQYRSSAVDRELAAKLIGYSSLSGPANKALAALASYGLLERAGKGDARVTERARAILHAGNDQERSANLFDAASSPALFRAIREKFQDIPVPPEDGVVTYLNREGFNPSAVRPAARAFLETMKFVEELRATESHANQPSRAAESPSVAAPKGGGQFGGARVGDLIQWESGGALQFEKPRRVRFVTDDGGWVAVEGSKTGVPMSEVIVQDRAAPNDARPIFPDEDFGGEEEAQHTDLRMKLGKGIVVQVRSKEELGPDELGKLIKLLEAQRDALM